MSSSIKNYTEQGGDRTVIGGELVIEEGARVTGLPSSNNSGATVLDLQGYNLFDALSSTEDITEIISPELFRQASSGQSTIVISNVTLGGNDSRFSLQGVETSQNEMIFAVGFLPNGADIAGFISAMISISTIDDVDRVLLRFSLNFAMNAALGFNLD